MEGKKNQKIACDFSHVIFGGGKRETAKNY
jgi:hypothetical protein